MDTFGLILVAGFSLAYVVELSGALLRPFRSDKIFKHIITPPLAFVACLYLDFTGFTLIVAALAASFVSTSLRVLLDAVTSKPVVIPRRM